MKNEDQSKDIKTAIKNIHEEVGQLWSDFDQLKTGLQDVQVKQEQLQIGQDRMWARQEQLQIAQDRIWARQEQMQIGQDKLQNDMTEVLGLLRTR